MTLDELNNVAVREMNQLPVELQTVEMMDRLRMKHTYPDFMYRFRRGSDRDLNALEQRQMWVPKFKRMADPHDGRLEISIEKAKKTWANYFKFIGGIPLAPNQIDRVFEPNEAQIKAYLAEAQSVKDWVLELGVMCLSRNIGSAAMWDYYADWHAGFAIEFDWRFDRMSVDMKDPRTYFTHVSYVDEYPDIDLAQLRTMPTHYRFSKLLYTKHSSYIKEDEFRMIHLEGGDTMQPIRFPISAIIFGRNLPQDKIDRIRQMFANEPSIEMRRIQSVPRQFKLEMVPYVAP